MSSILKLYGYEGQAKNVRLTSIVMNEKTAKRNHQVHKKIYASIASMPDQFVDRSTAKMCL